MEKKVYAQPLKQQAFTEVAKPCMGLVFIVSIMAAVFNLFVFVFWIIFFFILFVVFNFFFSSFKMNQFD